MKTDQQSHFLPHKRYPHATRKEKEEYNKQTANTKDFNQTVSVTRIFKVNCTCQSHLSIAAFIYTPSTLLKNSPFLYRLDLAPFYTLHYFLLFDPFQTGLFFLTAVQCDRVSGGRTGPGLGVSEARTKLHRIMYLHFQHEVITWHKKGIWRHDATLLNLLTEPKLHNFFFLKFGNITVKTGLPW